MNVKLQEIRDAITSPIYHRHRPVQAVFVLSSSELAALKAEYDAKAGPIKAEISELSEKVKKAKQAYQSTAAEKRINELGRELAPIDAQYAAVNHEVWRREISARMANDYIPAGNDIGNSDLAAHPELLESHGEQIAHHRIQHDRYRARYKEWDAIAAGTLEPTERHQAIIRACENTLDAKVFYQNDFKKAVITELGDFYTPDELTAHTERVEGGDVGMEIYLARKFVEGRRAKALEAAARENFQVGRKFKRINVGHKDFTSAVVVRVAGDIELCGNRGGKSYTIRAAATSIKIVA